MAKMFTACCVLTWTNPRAGIVVPALSGLAAIVSCAVAGIATKLDITVASSDNVTVVDDLAASATIALAVAVQLTNLYPCAGIAVIVLAAPAARLCAPTAGFVVPDAFGLVAIVKVTIRAKLAVTVASAPRATLVFAKFASLNVAFAVAVQFKNTYP